MKKLWIGVSIFVGIVIVFFLLLFLLFPRKYTAEINKYSQEYNLEPSMVASVINIESGYDRTAISNAGAVGLMQLLPSTANECARKMGLTMEEDSLYDVDINMRIGCYYLRYLLDIFDGNIINTLCAYNWGLGNVNDWMTAGNEKDGTITNIPVKETRDYVRKYRVNKVVYGIFL